MQSTKPTQGVSLEYPDLVSYTTLAVEHSDEVEYLEWFKEQLELYYEMEQGR